MQTFPELSWMMTPLFSAELLYLIQQRHLIMMNK